MCGCQDDQARVGTEKVTNQIFISDSKFMLVFSPSFNQFAASEEEEAGVKKTDTSPPKLV